MLSQTDEVYQETYKSLQNTGCAKVLQYFNKNWHPIRNEWVEGLKHQATTFGNYTNNRVEAINHEIMQVVKQYAPLQEMFSDLLIVLNSLHLEPDQRAMEALLKAPVVRNLTSYEEEYCNILTPYAFAIVSKELKKANEMDSLEQYAHLEVSEESCSCSVQLSVALLHSFGCQIGKMADLRATLLSLVAYTVTLAANKCKRHLSVSRRVVGHLLRPPSKRGLLMHTYNFQKCLGFKVEGSINRSAAEISKRRLKYWWKKSREEIDTT